MKRTVICLLALSSFACSNSGETSDGHGASQTGTPTTTPGVSSAPNANTDQSNAADTGRTSPTTDTSKATGVGGSTSDGDHGKATGAGGDASKATVADKTTAAGGARSKTSDAKDTGAGGNANTGSGGGNSTGSNAAGTSSGSGKGPIATGPVAKDPIAAAADLTKYYVSNKGDDANSGTSPEQPWATLGKLPKNKAIAAFFEKGSKWAIPVGGTSRSGLTVSAGSVYATYGTGDKPLFELQSSDGKAQAMGAVMLGGNNLVDGIKVKGYAAIGFPVSSAGNVIQGCEVDGAIEGEEFGKMQLGFSISGEHNLVVGNYVHDLSGLSGDTGNVNTSGGSEAYVMNAGNNEVAYNTAINCWVPNKTLNGAEGGCLEIIGNKAGQIIENAYFHHNYCERAVGLFEACAGNFTRDGQKIQLNHAVVRNSTVSYNVSVDAMWLYLLQPVNTDFDGLIFEHNTLIHGPANTEIPQGGAAAFGIVYDTDPVFTTGSNPTYVTCTADADCGEKEKCLERQGTGKICQYQWKVEPGNITVRNNLFVVLPGADPAMMVIPTGPNDFVNNLFSPKAPMGVKTGTNGIIVAADPGLADTYHLAPTSPALDKGSPDAMFPWLDYQGNKVPCGSAPDIGALEYCP